MFKANIKKQIVKAFGLEALRSGHHETRGTQKKLLSSFNVNSFWFAEIHYYPYPVSVCIVHSDQWSKGLLLVPPVIPPLDREFGGPNPLVAVEMKDWVDPVLEVGRAVDLFPKDDASYCDAPIYLVELVTCVNKFSTRIHLQGYSENLNIEKLWNAITSTVADLVKIYDDPEMSKCVKLRDYYW
jgi:hypothetical protein